MMHERRAMRWLCVCMVFVAAGSALSAIQSQELVTNPQFQRENGQALLQGWSVWKPQWEQAACAVRGAEGGLLMESGGDPYAVGGVTQEIRGIRAGTAYRISAVCELRGIEAPFRSVIVRIAIQICYDWFFPEPAALFAMKGAEIILAPTWGDTLPDVQGKVNGETTFRVRARDNGVYMVPSVYDGSSLVIDPMGRILASNAGRPGIFCAEVDLNNRECLDWVGCWRSVGPRDRMPETYGPLVDF